MQNPPNPYGQPQQQPSYPQYPSNPANPYGQYGQYPSQAQSYPSAPTAAAARKGGGGKRVGAIIAILLALLLLAGGTLGFIHYTGPTRTAQTFVEDVLVHYDAQSAYNLLCADSQAKVSLNQLQTLLSSLKSLGATYDLSQVTYTLVDEEFLGTAHVRLGGKAVAKVGGQSQAVDFGQSQNSTTTLRSAGLGWCLAENALTPTGP